MPILASSPIIFFMFILLAYVIDAVKDCLSDKRGHDKTNSCNDCKNS